MHARHRSPVTAYNRSNSIGMGGVGRVAAASRISPEGSMRGHEMYNSEYKSYNRDGVGRGQSKHFPQRSDVFMEAGRMAAEYLVRKGLLPQSVLSGKLQNGNLRNPLGYNSGFRAQEGDDMQVSVGNRTSALSRLGNHAADVVPGRKRYSDEYGAIGPKSYIRGRRRNGSFKDSEWNRDLGRSGSWSDRSRASQDVDNHPDHFLGYQDEKKFTKDSYSELQKSPPTEIIPETDSDGNLVRDSELTIGKYNSVSNTATKGSATSIGKDLLPEDEVGPIQMSAKMETSTGEAGEVMDDNNNDDMEQKSTEDDSRVQLRAEEDTQTSKKGTDLLSLCRFEKIPTRTRSSLTARSSRVVRSAMVEVKDTNESGHPAELGSHAEDMPSDPSLHQNHDIKPIGSDNSIVPAAEEGQIVAHAAEENMTRSLSFTDDAEMEGGVKNEEMTIFGNCSTAEIGQKRALDDDNGHEQNKKPREFTSSDDTQSNFFMYHSGLKEKQQNLHEPETANGKHAVLSPEHKRLVDVSLFPNGDVMQSAEFEEKQLFPSSFKTCDLNLMEASDMNDNHDSDADLIFPSITESGKPSASIDIDLSINSNCNLMDKYNKCGFGGKDIEVIDLENDSEQDSKTFNNQLGSSVTGFTGREGFPNNAHNVNEIADVQDGYGLMISELLGNDMPNCSSVPGDMNALHNDMGLHNGEGILGDDDSIYMSLGEIPISYLRPWEQPSQEFGKPF